MTDVSLISPTVGLTGIDWSADEVGPKTKRTFQFTGEPIQQSIRKLYQALTMHDIALGMTFPKNGDPDLQQPQHFIVAFLNVCDKVEMHMSEDPKAAAAAYQELKILKHASDLCRDNLAALNQA